MKIDIQKGEGRLLLVLEGRLDTQTTPQLEQTIHENELGLHTLVLDCAGVEFLSSAGLRALFAADKSMKSRGGCMWVKNINQQVRQTLTITGLIEVLNVE